MWCFNSVPGFVRPYSRRRIIRLSGASSRSIWRALMGAHLRFGGGRQHEAPAGPREPRRPQGFQAQRPRIAGRFPDRPECSCHCGVIARRSVPARPAAPGSNNRLPMVARDRHGLCQQAPLLPPRGPHVPVPHLRQIFLPRLWSHAGAVLWHTRFGNILSGATTFPSVTLTMGGLTGP